MMIVGICGGSYGKPGVGKTTAANALVEHLGFTRISMMDPVRNIHTCLGIGKDKDDLLKSMDGVCRAGRGISEDFWLNLAIKGMSGHDLVVLDDVWFGNEASFIRDNGGVVIMITRPGIPQDGMMEFTPDITINNVFDSPGDLCKAVVEIVREHICRSANENNV